MTARAVRRVVVALCVAGVAGLIVTSILDRQGAAVTIGLCTAVAVLCLIVATAVDGGRPPAPRGAAFDEAQAEVVERHVEALVADGGDEAAIRSLVREAVRLGRGASPQVGAHQADEGG
jgi:hypothetical protein